MSAPFDPHQMVQWCAAHPNDKAPKHTVGDLFEMQKHVLDCPECDAAKA